MLIKNNSSKFLSTAVDQVVDQLNNSFKSLGWKYKINSNDLEFISDTEKGDIAFPCFILSKKIKKAPNIIANELQETIYPNKLISSIENINGYLNFYLDKNKAFSSILEQILKEGEKYGSTNIGAKKKIMIEFSSPNTNKPLHLGHLRNIVVGWSVSKMLEFLNFRVIKATLLNDRGIHICKSMLAYDMWGNNKNPDIKADHFVGNYYVLFEKKSKENAELSKDLLTLLSKLEKNDPSIVSLWRKMNKWAESGFKETYLKLGVEFDKVYKESKIYKRGKEIVIKKFEEGVFEKDKNGAIFANLESFGLPNKVLLRSDGTSIYITQDIYLSILKFKEYDLEKSIYCVGKEQELYLMQLFKTLELIGYSFSDKCYHLSHGMVFLPEGKMKSREGKVVDADNLISELEDLASKEIFKRDFNVSKKKLKEISSGVGLAALKYYLLRSAPTKDIYFNPKESISFIGETGPYIQYSYARICSILKKAKESQSKKTNYSFLSLDNKEELDLVIFLAKFPSILEKAALNYNPSSLTQYLYKLADKSNSYYEKFPILKERKEVREARLILVKCIKTVLANGLNLLGIPVIEEM